MSMLNLVYSVSCQFSHCWLLWCFRTTPHFTHRCSFPCCSLSLLFCFFSIMHAPWNVPLPANVSLLFAHLPLLSCSLLGPLRLYPETAQVKLDRNEESFKMCFLNVIIMAPETAADRNQSFYCKWIKYPKLQDIFCLHSCKFPSACMTFPWTQK